MQNGEIDIACEDIMSTSHTNDDTIYIKIGMYIKHGMQHIKLGMTYIKLCTSYIHCLH